MPNTDDGALTIGDRSRDELIEIADTSWNDNGTLRVTVRELIGHKCYRWTNQQMIRKMRDLAKQAHPERHTRTKLIRTFYDGTCDYATFAVTRIGT